MTRQLMDVLTDSHGNTRFTEDIERRSRDETSAEHQHPIVCDMWSASLQKSRAAMRCGAAAKPNVRSSQVGRRQRLFDCLTCGTPF